MFSRAAFFVALAVFAGAQGNPLSSWFPFWPSGGRSGDHNLNWVVDEILKSVSSDLIHEGGDKYVLLNSALSTSEELDFLWWKIQASAQSDGDGTLKNLSSVIRSSDAGILQEIESGSLKNIVLKGELSLKDLEMEYSSATVSVGYISYTGGLSVKCPYNSFDVAIEINNGNSCPATVKSASIKSLSGCSVKLSQSGIFNWFKQYVLSYAFGKVIDSVIATENDRLLGVLTNIVQQHNLCKFLNPNMAS